MRWMLVLVSGVLLAWLGGCGGGGGQPAQPRETAVNKLVVRYFHWAVTVRDQTEDSHEISAGLQIPQTSSMFANLALAYPGGGQSLKIDGPALLPAAYGTLQGELPLGVYWGEGTVMPVNQPMVVQPGEWLPGYERPGEELYFYGASADLLDPPPVAGTYTMTADGGISQTWTAPTNLQELPPVAISYPLNIAVNSRQPIKITWNPLPNVEGYLVFVEGDLANAQGNTVAHIVWSPASTPITFEGLTDVTPYLLPPTKRAVTVPADCFRWCKAIQVNIYARSKPYTDASTTPNLKVVSESMQTQIYVLYE